MLILTRRVGESVMMGNDIAVSVMDVKGNRARLGIDAKADVAVHREEISDRIRRGSEPATTRRGEPRRRP